MFSSPYIKDGSPSGPETAVVSCFFVSIMSHLFHKEEAIRQITSYANTRENSIYIYGTRLYEATREALFGNEWTIDPIEKELGKCKKLLERHKAPSSEAIDWSVFYNIPQYEIFRKFTDAITNPHLSRETLQSAFQDVEDEPLTLLLASLDKHQFSKHMSDIAKSFAEKNKDKLSRQVSKLMRDQKQLTKLKNKSRSKTSSQEPESAEPPADLDMRDKLFAEQTEKLRLGTYKLLSDEFSAFMTTDTLTPENIRTYFKISLDLDDTTNVKMEKWYPVTATTGAKEIFDAHYLVATLYHEHAEALGLPIIPMAEAVNNIPGVDPLDPNNDNKQKAGKSSQTSKTSSLLITSQPLDSDDASSNYSNSHGEASSLEDHQITKDMLDKQVNPDRSSSPPQTRSALSQAGYYGRTLDPDELAATLDQIIDEIRRIAQTPDRKPGGFLIDGVKIMLETKKAKTSQHVYDNVQDIQRDIGSAITLIHRTHGKAGRLLDFNYEGCEIKARVSLDSKPPSPSSSRDRTPSPAKK